MVECRYKIEKKLAEYGLEHMKLYTSPTYYMTDEEKLINALAGMNYINEHENLDDVSTDELLIIESCMNDNGHFTPYADCIRREISARNNKVWEMMVNMLMEEAPHFGDTIICDTRQKQDKNAHITEQLEELGYKVVRSKLYCGDYTWATNQQICIDTKQDLSEVVNNVVHDHERFKNECIRAQEAGIQLIILVTEPKVTCLADVFGWFNPRLRYNKKATTGRTLGKILYSMQHKYDVRFEFCTKDNVGERIVELLGGQT